MLEKGKEYLRFNSFMIFLLLINQCHMKRQTLIDEARFLIALSPNIFSRTMRIRSLTRGSNSDFSKVWPKKRVRYLPRIIRFDSLIFDEEGISKRITVPGRICECRDSRSESRSSTLEDRRTAPSSACVRARLDKWNS